MNLSLYIFLSTLHNLNQTDTKTISGPNNYETQVGSAKAQ